MPKPRPDTAIVRVTERAKIAITREARERQMDQKVLASEALLFVCGLPVNVKAVLFGQMGTDAARQLAKLLAEADTRT